MTAIPGEAWKASPFYIRRISLMSAQWKRVPEALDKTGFEGFAGMTPGIESIVFIHDHRFLEVTLCIKPVQAAGSSANV
jgi:hypothetical protein